MEIKTKYNPRDTVWCVFHSTDVEGMQSYQCDEYRIDQVNVIVEYDWTAIMYKFENPAVSSPEEFVFITQQEAQAECDKRNKGEG